MSPRLKATFGGSSDSFPATPARLPLAARTEAALTAAGLDPVLVVDLVTRALAEDLPADSGLGVDVTSAATVPATLVATGRIVSRARGVVAGLPVAAAV